MDKVRELLIASEISMVLKARHKRQGSFHAFITFFIFKLNLGPLMLNIQCEVQRVLIKLKKLCIEL